MRLFMFCTLLLSMSCHTGKRDDSPGSPPSDTPTYSSPHHNHVVMMIDTGIDPNHDAYKDNVIASYTIFCEDVEDKGWPQDGNDLSTEQFEKEFENNLPDGVEFGGQHCILQDGINTTSVPPTGDVLTIRDKWNLAIKKHRLHILSKIDILTVLNYLRKNLSSYHGTNTTAIVAYRNPNVKFVLMEKKLKAASDPGISTEACHSLKQSAPIMGRFADHELQRVCVEKGSDSESSLIHELAIKHRVTLINKSYGLSSRDMADLLKDAGCPDMNEPLMTYFSGIAEIKEGIRSKNGIAYDQTPYLTIQSAGNEGITVNNRKDLLDCPNNAQHLMVGSYRIGGQRSKFSNYGECVTLFNLGSNVITSNPQNFLTITDGTSFSAPLTVRYISFEFSEKIAPSSIVSELKKRLNSSKFLPQSKHYRYAAYDAEPWDLHLAKDTANPVIVVDNPLNTTDVFNVLARFHEKK